MRAVLYSLGKVLVKYLEEPKKRKARFKAEKMAENTTIPSEPPAVTGLSLSEAAPAEQNLAGTVVQDVNPWSVSGEVVDGVTLAIDYDKLIQQFGTKRIDAALLERFEKVTGHKAHRFLRRGIVFSHRELEIILKRHEEGKPFFLYTGRGPSSDSMHIGHMVPFAFTK
jgi:tryptophanyl-tRNA synthetase